MIKTLTKHGNSFALVIDKPILDILNIQPGTPLNVRTDGNQLIISPVRRKKILNEAMDDMNKRYGGMLKRLAD